MPSHTLYIDDSGQREYAAAPDRYGHHNTRHFVLGGVLASTVEAGRLTQALRDMKAATFGRSDVEIKSNWLRIPHERERRFLERFGITEADLRDLVDGIYGTVAEANVRLLAAVVDKVHMQEDYATPWYPPAVAYDCLLQRAEQELADSTSTFSVTIDDTTGKNPKGNEYKTNLARQHRRIKQRGSGLLKGLDFPSLEGRLKFVDSGRSDLVQVADIVAYNVLRQFRDHGDAWEDQALDRLPLYEYLGPMLGRFRHDGNGRIQGYGIVKMPLRRRVPWRLRPE